MTEQVNVTETVESIDETNLRFGKPLRDAREEHGLSVDDIVDKLHINKQYIEAIEDENFSSLPQPAFVRGYIRNYANFLEIESDVLLMAYNYGINEGEPEKVTTASSRATLSSSLSPIRKSKVKSLRKFIVTIILFIGLAFISWKLWQAFQQGAGNNDVTSSSWRDWISFEVDERGDALDVLNTSVNDLDTPLSSLIVDEDLQNISTPATAFDMATTTSLNNTVSNTLMDTSQIVSDEQKRTQIITANEQPVIISGNVLKLTSAEKAWVQIKQDTQLIYRGEIAKGEFIRELDTPIHLRIGNAEKVILSYGGEVIDLKPLTKNSLAVLSVVMVDSLEN